MFSNRSLFLLIPALLSVMFAFSSCDKEVNFEPTPPHNIPEKTFFAIVDGVEFIDTILWGAESSTNSTLTITATAEGGYPKMTFNIPSDLAPGSYNLGGSTSTHQALIKFGTLATMQFSALSGSGTLVVAEHDLDADYIIASFSFTGIASPGNPSLVEFDVTDGQFTISY